MIPHLKGDCPPHLAEFRADALRGLGQRPRVLPCKWFYDERGSALFDQICALPEYYPTRTELKIMESSAQAMAKALGEGTVLLEYGSGSSLKTRVLLKELQKPVAYVPLDISREHLLRSATRLQREFPGLSVVPWCADYTEELALPLTHEGRVAAYFPGSTIGNFAPEEALAFLRRTARLVGPGGALLIGVDLLKNRDVLRAAYNDTRGVTAAFNLNLLERMNRELGADFQLRMWGHEARWNEAASRIEMYLIASMAQTVHLQGHSFNFEHNEDILTEYSHKYSLASFQDLAGQAGFAVECVWTDEEQYFSVQLLRAA